MTSDAAILADAQRAAGWITTGPPVADRPAARKAPPYQADRLHSQHYCGHGTIIGHNATNTEILLIPVTCKSWDCPKCGPRKRAMWIARLARGHPQREITLTAPPLPNATPREHAAILKIALNKLLKALRKRDSTFEYALVWELTKKGVPHVHLLQRGTYIPQAWLAKQWSNAGGGDIVWIASVRGESLHAAHACKYLGKATGQTARDLAPLRIIQVSRHYVLPEPDPHPTPQTHDFEWTYSPKRKEQILARLLTSLIPHEAMNYDDDSTLIIWTGDHPAFEFVPFEKGAFYDVEPTPTPLASASLPSWVD